MNETLDCNKYLYGNAGISVIKVNNMLGVLKRGNKTGNRILSLR